MSSEVNEILQEVSCLLSIASMYENADVLNADEFWFFYMHLFNWSLKDNESS